MLDKIIQGNLFAEAENGTQSKIIAEMANNIDNSVDKNELKIKQKVFDMMLYAYPALAQFPKSEKFSLVADMKRCMNNLLEYIIEADKKYYKKTTLQMIDVELEKLKTYVRLSHKLGFLPMKKYEYWSGLLVEIGKMLGGWIKSVKK